MKKVLTIGIVLTLLLALGAPAFALAPSEATGAKLYLSAPELEKSDADQTTNIYLYSDMALSVDTVGVTFSTASDQLEIGTATSPISGALCSNTAVNFSAASPVELAYDETAGGYLIATIPVTVKAGATGTFTVNFTMDVTDMASGADFDFYGSEPKSTTIKVTATDPTPTEGYTVTVSDGVDGTAEVEIGAEVTMKVTVTGAAFNGIEGTVSYDNTLFKLTGVSVGGSSQTFTDSGSVQLEEFYEPDCASGTEVATLTFEALAAGTGSFTFAGTVGDYDDFANHDAVDAEAVNDSVTVKAAPTKYAVEITTVEHATIVADKSEAAEGEAVVITVTADDGYQIDSVSIVDASNAAVTPTINGNKYTVTMPASKIIVSAVVSEIPATQYDVELPSVANATVTANKTKAAEGEIVTITVTPAEGYQVDEVTVEDESGNPVTVTDNKDGTYTVTMPASKITVSVTVSEIPPAFTVAVSQYVTGINLVLVTGDAVGYTYNGQAMYKIDAYGTKAFAYLDSTSELKQSDAAALVAEATATAADHVLASGSYEVNGTTKVDFNDAGAAFGCYNAAYTLADNMAMYLRADVNGDKTVDSSDVSAIMDKYS